MPSLTRRHVLAAAGTTGVALAGCLSCSAPSGDLGSVEGSWPMVGGNAAQTRQSPDGPTDPDSVWTASPDDARGAGAPAVDGGRLFVPVDAVSDDARYRYRLHALAAATGEEHWQVPLRSEPTGPPAARGSRVAVTTSLALERGRVVAFDTESGEERWLVDVDARLTATPTLDDDGVVHVPDWSGRLHAFRLSTGDELWTRAVGDGDTDRSFARPAAVADGTVYLGSQSGETGVVALDAATGDQQWTASTPRVTGGPVAHDGGVVVQCNQLLVAFATDGSRRWSVNVPGRTAGPLAADDQHVYVPGRTALVAVDWSGTKAWVFDPEDDRAGTPTVAADDVVVHGEGSLTALDAESGAEQWTTTTDDGSGGVAVTPEAIFLTAGGDVTALGEQ